ncbi:Polyphosphate kinase 2 [compost metagenome]
MLRATDSGWAPWFVANNDDKKRGRLNIISHLLSQIPYEPLPPSEVKLPRRQASRGYVDPGITLHLVPEKY